MRLDEKRNQITLIDLENIEDSILTALKNDTIDLKTIYQRIYEKYWWYWQRNFPFIMINEGIQGLLNKGKIETNGQLFRKI